MDFSGERFVPSADFDLEMEHMHRYLAIQHLVKGLRVLDIASGEGYGSFILAQTSQSVIGVDLSIEAISHAKMTYGQQDNLQFVQGSVSRIPCDTHSVDCVVSFETIEHVAEHDQMLLEISRVLRPEGFLIVSTPDKAVYSELRNYHNEYHVRELHAAEFFQLLNKYFRFVDIHGQRFVTVSSITQFRVNLPRHIPILSTESDQVIPQPVYLLAICSNQVQHPVLESSLCYSSDKDQFLRNEEKLRWASRVHDELMAEKSQVHTLMATCDVREQDLLQMKIQNQVYQEQMKLMNFQIESQQSKLEQMCKVDALKDQSKALVDTFIHVRTEIDELKSWTLNSQECIQRMEDQFDGLHQQMAALRDMQSAQNLQLSDIRMHFHSEANKSKNILGSVLWFICLWLLIKPYRVIRQTRRDRGRNLKTLLVRLCRAGYYTLPFSADNKHRISSWIYRLPLKFFFKDVHHYQAWLLSKSPITSIPNMEKIEKSEYLELLSRLEFQCPVNPEVSIIIPTYGKIEYTLRCLESISKHVSTNRVEVIVLDDASQDPDLTFIGHVKGIKFISNEINLGFVRNCNKGADIARGIFLCFLNNDTCVLENWLDELLYVVNNFADVGVVGSKLIYPDGRLQEAGGIVWKDASAWNYGRLANPDSAAFNYVKETDYVSGASLLISKEIFHKVGGFGEEYAPAYCEDTDLCFKVRQAGLKVYYQPFSRLVHFEGVSNGTDTSSGIKAYQVVNQKTFFSKWKDVLDASHWRNADCVFRARECGMGKKFVLVIDHYVPQPDRDAGSRSMYQFMECMLKLGYRVKLLPANMWYDPVYTSWYQRRGIEVIYGDACNGTEDYLKQNLEHFEVVFLSRPYIADPLISMIKTLKSIPIVFYGHDIHHCRLMQQKENNPGTVHVSDIVTMRDIEFRVWSQLDCIAYPSSEEVRYLVEHGFADKSFLLNPFYIETHDTPPCSLRNRSEILFVGGFAHTPNIDAAIWFVHQVFPLIRNEFPEVHLNLVGSNPSESVKELQSESVTVTGYVSDEVLKKYYDRARVAVIPLLYGAGIKGKVIEACQMGLPLVTTHVGVQGMPMLGNIVKISMEPDEFARNVLSIMNSDEDWDKQSCEQKKFVQVEFSRDILMGQIKQLLETKVKHAA